jgi:hypothetical protein
LNTYEQADALLDVLHKAPVGTPGALFSQVCAKEWMESCVVRAVKKLQAAEYHRANIDSKIQDLHRKAEETAREGYTSLVRSEYDSVAFELDAFLAAARSCIDFISGMLALHFEGMNRRTSIATLLNKADKHPTAPFSGLLMEWRVWIEQVRNYRDECVHYRTIHMTGGYKVVSRGGNAVATVLPILVAQEIPPDKPTTRRERGQVEFLADIQEMVGIAGVPSCAESSGSEAAERLTNLLSELGRTRRGMVPIEDFCGQHLEKLHRFVSASFKEVVDLGFRSCVG